MLTAEATARRLQTQIGALKSRLASNDELHATETGNLRAAGEAAEAAHAGALQALQQQLAEAQRGAAVGEIARLQVNQLQAKIDAMVSYGNIGE